MERDVVTNKKNKFRTGFTIIELLVVIVIIGILAAITLVSYNGIQAKARDASVLSDLDTMDALQTNYGLKNGLAGKAYYSGSGSDTTLGFTPSSGNVIDVVTNSTDYCIRGYNTKGTKNSINNSFTKESTLGICSTLNPSATAIANSPTSISVTGGTVTYSGGYTIRTFTSSGTLTVTGGTISGAQVLVVAGGGGGGNSAGGSGGGGGGGGAGGLLSETVALTGSMGITVGALGAHGTVVANGSNGGNSVFAGYTAIGGGGGGGYDSDGVNGGSGGGVAYSSSHVLGTPGTGTSGQGYAGGNRNVTYAGGGGGGGASGVGAAAGTNHQGGAGGPGTANSITGSSVTYAAGGKGGSWPDGGGTAPSSGAANSGCAGGGGYGASYTASDGGSGVVIIRYLTP